MMAIIGASIWRYVAEKLYNKRKGCWEMSQIIFFSAKHEIMKAFETKDFSNILSVLQKKINWKPSEEYSRIASNN